MSAKPTVEMYMNPMCPYCAQAKALLAEKGVEPMTIDIWADPPQKRTMIERSGGRATVPQIFIGETHVGGCDDLFALERKGGLDALLAGG